ncbi:VOC family protein [Pseudomonas sp. MT3]|uniref:VOC family protein n=1 Tax=Pseudomonas sp. ATCC 13867 TaxID=1294143 RepID=UPI0002C4EE4C|nr:VOC family protein [Pseudomonas sp. ATCC 13867]AGI24694.1 3-demethylubiquinone-9 3-methyltransferase [Pseudomonas sp. ATCC 13867]RFQ36317.1 VOC family protein [Pseudomonas sp. ATCC 13867]
MPSLQRINPCLWFDNQAEEAVGFYTGIFPNSRIGKVAYYSEAGREHHGKEPGSVLTVAFELDGQSFLALNGGPVFSFNEAVSLVVHCDSQAEIDHYWDRLSAGGPVEAQMCGWLKDRFGLSWQIVPRHLGDMVADADPVRATRTMQAVFSMKKLDMAALERAHAGN